MYKLTGGRSLPRRSVGQGNVCGCGCVTLLFLEPWLSLAACLVCLLPTSSTIISSKKGRCLVVVVVVTVRGRESERESGSER